MEDFSQYVPNVHFEKIPIKNLVSNQDYQRNLSLSHVEKTAENFDLYQINPVKVSRRDGINYVFDGQHTIMIVYSVSGSKETPVWCMVYDDLSYEHEADIFANQMKYTKKLQPIEIFEANIEAGNHDQQMIKDLVESYGMTIGVKKAPGVISAVSTLENIYFKFGIHVLRRVLRLCIGTWEGDINSFTGNIMNGIAKLIVTYKEALDDELFKEKLGAISPKLLTRTAHDRRPGSMGFAEAMVIFYNGKKKNPASRLPMNKLYARDSHIFDVEDEDYMEEDTYDIYDDQEEIEDEN